MPKYKIVLLPLFVVFLSSCFWQFDPYGGLYVTKKPEIQEIIGTYTLTTQTLTDGGLDFLQDRRATIEINSDGTFVATNFPLWQEPGIAEYKIYKLLTDTGSWSLGVVGGDSIDSFWGIIFSSRKIPPASLIDDEVSLGFSLMFTYGDPDSGDIMIFERSNVNKDEN